MENRAKVYAANKRWRAKNKELVQSLQRKWRYGVTPDMWSALLQSYGSACAICRRPGTPDHRLCLDEFHRIPRNKRVHEQRRYKWKSMNRGVLCFSCNNAIGLLGESTRVLLRAKHYMLRPPAARLHDRALKRHRRNWLRRAPMVTLGRLLAVQGFRCAICVRKLNEETERVHVDHIPGTRTIRGILCRFCNPGIALLGHEIDRVQAAVNYVRYWREIHQRAHANGLQNDKHERAKQILEIHLSISKSTSF